MNITVASWERYIKRLNQIDSAAADDVKKYYEKLLGRVRAREIQAQEAQKQLVNYCYGVATKYGEASASTAAEMYDAIADLTGVYVPPAVPAETATYGEVAKTVNGVLKQSLSAEMLSGAVSRLAKRAGADTMLQNAKRDGAQVAWIPNGDTCPYCIAFAAAGWEDVSKAYAEETKTGLHAKHLHGNCDCTYGVRFNTSTNYASYTDKDISRYHDMYYGAPGRTSKERLNAMRRQAYADNREKILAQKADAYEKRKELNESAAEEINAN